MENDVFLGYSWEIFGEFLDYSDDIDQKHQVNCTKTVIAKVPSNPSNFQFSSVLSGSRYSKKEEDVGPETTWWRTTILTKYNRKNTRCSRCRDKYGEEKCKRERNEREK